RSGPPRRDEYCVLISGISGLQGHGLMYGFRKNIAGKSYNSRGLVAARYDRNVRTIDRWIRDPRVNFPLPDITLLGRDYWSTLTLDEFDERCAAEQETAVRRHQRRAARVARFRKGKKVSRRSDARVAADDCGSGR